MTQPHRIYPPVVGEQFSRKQVEIWQLRKKGVEFDAIAIKVKMSVDEVELIYNEVDGWVQLDSAFRNGPVDDENNEREVSYKEAQLLGALEAIAFSKLIDFCTWNNSGVFVKASEELTELQHQAISEIHQDANGNVRIKLHSKLAALETLLKYHKVLPDTKDGQRQAIPIKVVEIEAHIVNEAQKVIDEITKNE